MVASEGGDFFVRLKPVPERLLKMGGGHTNGILWYMCM